MIKKRGQGLVRAGDTDFLKDGISGVTIETRKIADPPVKPTEFENVQLNLFQNFLCNTEEERERFSNAIDLWDSVPRYSVSRQADRKSVV